jgi:hypothetical protein
VDAHKKFQYYDYHTMDAQKEHNRICNKEKGRKENGLHEII